MRYLFLTIFIFYRSVFADTVGVDVSPWVSTSNTIDPQIVDQIVQETKRQKSKIIQTSTPQIIKQEKKVEAFTTKKDSDLLKSINDFFKPILEFVDRYPWQFATILLLTLLLFYSFLFLPYMLMNRKERQNDDIDLSEHIVKKVDSKPEGKVLSNSQFSELKGRLNESYIYQKEEILFSESMDQNQKDRDLMNLEWKYNQILNFALPKLDTKDAVLFKEGVKELLEGKNSREIVRAFLRDLIQGANIDDKRREFLKNSIS